MYKNHYFKNRQDRFVNDFFEKKYDNKN